MAGRALRTQFHVFQGINDWNTPVEPVRSEAVRSAMTRVLTSILSE